MKLNKETHFPYPVLDSQTTDYKKGSFSLLLNAEEVPYTGKLKINYEVLLNEDGLREKIDNKSAMVGMFITCLDTFYNKVTFLQELKGSVEFPPGTFKGRSSVRPLICAVQNIIGYSNENLNDEYGEQTWDFETGSLLSIGDESVINVGHEKLAPMESIFKLAVNAELNEGEISVQTDSDSIIIHCSKTIYETIHGLRQSGKGKSIILNGIYLPVVMEVLSHLKDGASSFAEKKWYKVFNAKCEHLGIEYANCSFLEDAQKLLKLPISKLKSVGDDL